MISDEEEDKIMRELEEANKEASWESEVKAALSGNLRPALARLLKEGSLPPRAKAALENLPSENKGGRPRNYGFLDFIKSLRPSLHTPRGRAAKRYWQLRAKGVAKKDAIRKAAGYGANEDQLADALRRGDFPQKRFPHIKPPA